VTDYRFRGDDLDRADKHGVFDPVLMGKQHGLSAEVCLELWVQARAESRGRDGLVDDERAQQRFLRLAKLAATAKSQGLLSSDPGRTTRHDLETSGLASEHARFAAHVPGKNTLDEMEARRWERAYGAAATTNANHAETPQQNEVSHSARTTPLDPAAGSRMSHLFGVDLTRVTVVPNSPLATGSTKAVTKAGEVHFRTGAYQPGTPEGDRLIAHELAHVVQQQGRGTKRGSRSELEREADRAAALTSRGRAATIALRGEPTTAYAFNEGEHHDGTFDEVAEHAGGSDPAAQGPAHANHDAKTDDHEKADDGESMDAHEAGDAPGQDHPVGAEADVSAVLPGEETAGGARGAGDGAPARPRKEPPSGAATPEVALGQLHGVRPDKMTLLFGQMHVATTADIAKARAAQQANPPKQRSTGATTAPKNDQAEGGATATASNPKRAADPKAATDPKAAKGGTDHPVKADVSGADVAKQARQRDVAAQREAVTQVVAATKRSIESWFGTWSTASQKPRDDANAVKMSEKETRDLVGSVDQLPTTASDVSTDTGPAPKLAMKSEAKGSADRDRAELEKTAAALETLNRADSGAPMGEDHIDATVAAEELTATLPSTAAKARAAALPTVAGAATSEEVGIVAQEQHGAEIDAALTQAGSDITTKRAEEAQAEAHARAEADTQICALKVKADADEVAARSAAQAEVQRARVQWQTEISRKGADARKQADKKVAEGMSQVDAEEAKANAEARQHLEEGKRKAEEEKHKGEKDAADAKAKGKSKSSGFWGWVSSKAKAVANGIKHAVTAAIDACRRAVKAVIAAAKKLAMAVIEIARKVIVGLIKAVGNALIAITGVLLAGFPALKEKFQNAIRKSVDKAVSTVNKLAEGLKNAVKKTLDWLGGALDKALQLLENGIHLVIDAASAVVQGAIKAAQAIVETLGTWARLIKDVATGPGSWIRKLGAAVVDGIKNHLWSAFKTTVMEWFKSKVFELLGVGGIVLQVLLDGGLTREAIIQMALDALLVAIPMALVAILVEKLVSMIVPAAGAVMAIIEGLQAAWGTISRIVAAFAAFMAFLLAVKSSGAGPLFASVLAGAAVVVLDFVANWLLKKLASAARKVGARLKGLAEKFKSKRKAKKDAKSSKKHHDHDHAKVPRKHNDHDATASKNHDEKQPADQRAAAQKRLDAARSALRAYLKRPRGRLALKAKLLQLKLRHRLKELSLQVNGNKAQIHGRINPEFIEYADAEVIVSNEELTDQAQSEGLVSFFRSMSLAELKKIAASGRLTTKANKGKPSSEMMLAEQNFFATHAESEHPKDLGKGYSVDLIERKQNTRGSKGYDYAVLVKIDVLRSAKTDVLLNPQNARLDTSTTTPNRDVLKTQGVDLGAVTTPISAGERGVVMLKVESNRGTAVATEGKFEPTKVMNYSIRPVDPEGLLEGDPLTEFNKKIYRITLIGGGIGRREIVFL
jgi:Domain of unknown function (DUF4157)